MLAVNGATTFSFESILSEVALGSPEEVVLTVLEPGSDEPRDVAIRPEYRERGGFQSIDVEPGYDPEHELVVAPDMPALAAGLRTGDRLLRVVDAIPHSDISRQFSRLIQRAVRDGHIENPFRFHDLRR